jgi:F0F1-type ATP synthase assembly protein I
LRRFFADCYTSASWQGVLLPNPPSPGNRIRSVLNSVAAGRRQAQRVLVVQTTATLIAALVFLVPGDRGALSAALGAALGGGAVALGGALMAWRSFSGGVIGAGAALARLFGGLALKWLVVLGALYLALAHLELPPVAVLAGLAVALAASLVDSWIQIVKVNS